MSAQPGRSRTGTVASTSHLCSVCSSRAAFPASRMSSATDLNSSGHSRVPWSSVRSRKASCQKSGLLVLVPRLPKASGVLSETPACVHSKLPGTRVGAAESGRVGCWGRSPAQMSISSNGSSMHPSSTQSCSLSTHGLRAANRSLLRTAANSRPAWEIIRTVSASHKYKPSSLYGVPFLLNPKLDPARQTWLGVQGCML